MFNRREKNNANTYEPHHIGATLKISAMLIDSYLRTGSKVHYVMLPGTRTAISFNPETSTVSIFDLTAASPNNIKFPKVADTIKNCLLASDPNLFDKLPNIKFDTASVELSSEGRKAELKAFAKADASAETIVSHIHETQLVGIQVTGTQQVKAFINALEVAAKKFHGKTIELPKEILTPTNGKFFVFNNKN